MDDRAGLLRRSLNVIAAAIGRARAATAAPVPAAVAARFGVRAAARRHSEAIHPASYAARAQGLEPEEPKCRR